MSNSQLAPVDLDVFRRTKRTAEQAEVPSSIPHAPSSILHGGDAVKNDQAGGWGDKDWWGTLAFAAQELTIEKEVAQNAFEWRTYQDALLSCNHVLARLDAGVPNVDTISSAQSGRHGVLADFLPVTDQSIRPVDVAIARLNHGQAAEFGVIRGLGPITGIRQPTDHNGGFRIFKYGAKTGLTAGVDVGWKRNLYMTAYGSRTVSLRKTSTDFADVHDSGAAVLDEHRNVIGIIVSGRINGNSRKNPSYYFPLVPLDEAPSLPGGVRHNAMYLKIGVTGLQP